MTKPHKMWELSHSAHVRAQISYRLTSVNIHRFFRHIVLDDLRLHDFQLVHAELAEIWLRTPSDAIVGVVRKVVLAAVLVEKSHLEVSRHIQLDNRFIVRRNSFDLLERTFYALF